MKKFNIFKVENPKSEKAPTHNMVVIEGEGENKVYKYIGVCWTKQGANGAFLSCQMNEKYNDKPGYVISEEGEGFNPTEEKVKEDVINADDIF